MTETWERWEAQVVDGKYPLDRFLGASEHSAVFRTESKGSRAVIKFVPETSVDTGTQLGSWRAAAQLEHPNLIRILDSGRCQLGAAQFLYVVMEHGDEDLAQILRERPLTGDETRQMLDGVLKALAFLHARKLVHGRVRPSNILAVGEQVKLSSDSVRPVGGAMVPEAEKSIYNAPEDGNLAPSADVWSAGVLLSEALTQHLPLGSPGASDDLSLPEGIPEPFREVVRRCLQLDPKQRWTPTEIAARMGIALPEVAGAKAGVAKSTRSEPVRGAAVHTAGGGSVKSSRKWAYVLALLMAGVIVAVLATWPRTPRVTQSQPTQAETSENRQAGKAAEASPAEATPGANTSASSRGAVVEKVLPQVSASARHTITGKIKVQVKVDVDAAGNVTQATLHSPGPSKYFARLALESARGWKFEPAQADGKPVPSEWMLRFAFGRNGTEVSPVQTAP